jgi:ankyrin repeat protein
MLRTEAEHKQYNRAEQLAADLLLATDKGDATKVGRLLSAGADPDAPSLPPQFLAQPYSADIPPIFPLICAVGKGHLEVTRRLLEAGGNLNFHDNSGYTPLITAAINGWPKVLQLLLEHGAVIDDTLDGSVDGSHVPGGEGGGGTAFHAACCDQSKAGRQAECMEVLVQAGCDVSLLTKEGRTGRELAERAADSGREGARELLERLDALVRQQKFFASIGPIMLLTRSSTM